MSGEDESFRFSETKVAPAAVEGESAEGVPETLIEDTKDVNWQTMKFVDVRSD